MWDKLCGTSGFHFQLTILTIIGVHLDWFMVFKWDLPWICIISIALIQLVFIEESYAETHNYPPRYKLTGFDLVLNLIAMIILGTSIAAHGYPVAALLLSAVLSFSLVCRIQIQERVLHEHTFRD